jgi:hypothetical protein
MRYAIINASNAFFTQHKEIETIPILAEIDMAGPGGGLIKKGDRIGDKHVIAPIFDSLKEMDASKFDTEADALAQIAAWGDEGKGCKTVEVR